MNERSEPDPSSPDRWGTFNEFAQHKAKEIVGEGQIAAAYLWFVLYSVVDRRTEQTTRSIQNLCDISGLNRSTVRESINYLIKVGAITRIRAGKKPHSAVYIVPTLTRQQAAQLRERHRAEKAKADEVKGGRVAD